MYFFHVMAKLKFLDIINVENCIYLCINICTLYKAGISRCKKGNMNVCGTNSQASTVTTGLLKRFLWKRKQEEHIAVN